MMDGETADRGERKGMRGSETPPLPRPTKAQPGAGMSSVSSSAARRRVFPHHVPRSPVVSPASTKSAVSTGADNDGEGGLELRPSTRQQQQQQQPRRRSQRRSSAPSGPPPPPPSDPIAPDSKVGSLDFERVVNEYSIQATQERLLLSEEGSERSLGCVDEEADPLMERESGMHDTINGYHNGYETFEHYSMPPPPPPASQNSRVKKKRRPKKNLLGYTGRTATRWMLTGATGLLTGISAIFIVYCTEDLINLRESFLSHINDRLSVIWFVLYCLYNLLLSLTSSFLSITIAPEAIGSGIPEIKAYLNGVRVKRFTSLKLLFVKMFATILSVSSGLVIGPEGPLVHVGAILGASMTKLGPTLNRWGICRSWAVNDLSHFSTDAERRDLISTGAAAGFASAFGAPIGGLLFSLEEASSFFAYELLWKTLTATAMATFCIAIYHGDLARYSVINLVLNTPNNMVILHRFIEMPFYVLLGALGGTLGGFFVLFWKYMNVRRKQVLKSLPQEQHLYARLLEVALLSIITSSLMFWLPSVPWECQPPIVAPGAALNPPLNATQVMPTNLHSFYCANGMVNQMGTIFFGSRVSAITYILQDPSLIDPRTLLIVGVLCYVMLMLTMGVALPTGIFLPSILAGASLGGFFGFVVQEFFLPTSSPSIFALLGAAALLGGIQRSTVSLCVILVEGTGQIKALIPVIITVMVARYVGDQITHGGLYEIGMELNEYPFLDHHVKKTLDVITVSTIMSFPPQTLGTLERAQNIERILRDSNHHGFPVVDKSTGKLLGLVRRDQLCALLEYGIFEDEKQHRTGTPGIAESPLMNYAYHIKDDRYDDVIYDTNALNNDFDENAWFVEVVKRTEYTSVDSLPQSEHPIEEEICKVGIKKDGTLMATLDPQYARKFVNVGAVMNRGTHCVMESCPVSKAYELFTALGLRHLIVLGEKTGGRVVGVITRSNLADKFMEERTGYEL